MNLESFIEATDLGKLAYEACGFVYAGTNYMESAKRNASPQWRELEREMQYVFLFSPFSINLTGGVVFFWWWLDTFGGCMCLAFPF